MSEPRKQGETDADVDAFLASVAHAGRREDAQTLCRLMADISGQPPRMWGDTMVGFGLYHYKRRDGSAHTHFRTGFAPRKANLVVYIMPGFKPYGDHLARLGPHKHSVSCLYLGRLAKVDLDVLADLIRQSLVDMDRLHPA